jgi:hypothetical protein
MNTPYTQVMHLSTRIALETSVNLPVYKCASCVLGFGLMKTPRISVVLTEGELRKLRGGFPAHTSDSNVIRRHLNLDPMAHGGLRNGHKSKRKQSKK